MQTRDALAHQSWFPRPPVVFTVTKPKNREVYAAHYQDRVVHHWLVRELEALIDRDFIHDAAANRTQRGTHFAVARLQRFMRCYHTKAWFLQLDISNFFNSIHHPTLLALLAHKLAKAQRRHGLSSAKAGVLFEVAQRIIEQPCALQAIHISAKEAYQRVPMHKRLECAPPHTGLPIGNLTSQFFANLYLNELDQFIKHQLRCRHYVRYVDDFIILHAHARQLQHWQDAIASFLHDTLHLRLKTPVTLAPIQNGANFLGYIVRPSYLLVRHRVVANLYNTLHIQTKQCMLPVAQGYRLELTPKWRDALRSTLASYGGHFRHAQSYRLHAQILHDFPWLALLFCDVLCQRPRWQPECVTSMSTQWRWYQTHYPGSILLVECGRELLCSALPGHIKAKVYQGSAHLAAWSVPMQRLADVQSELEAQQRYYIFCSEQGYLKGGLKRRCVRTLYLPQSQYFDILKSLPTF
ncbi:RNA-directed DNA polymerase [Thiorhodospira sibirica]|uniref:RNA-directed DNA polymerase n=1 Tax=Thiorhodospira sibirica TaxID=154347 RepID=UPI00300D98DE